ncbi:hypothetical protein BC940DRAFT_322466 [Gongronella butleri]|nr:hypothetical protein BC940DRAFT_322466 [Gongronella butleri]
MLLLLVLLEPLALLLLPLLVLLAWVGSGCSVGKPEDAPWDELEDEWGEKDGMEGAGGDTRPLTMSMGRRVVVGGAGTWNVCVAAVSKGVKVGAAVVVCMDDVEDEFVVVVAAIVDVGVDETDAIDEIDDDDVEDTKVGVSAVPGACCSDGDSS